MGKRQDKFEFDALESERVVLRLLTLADSAAVFRHFSDPDVARFVDIPEGMDDIHCAEEVIRYHLADTGCRWGIFSRATGRLIGTCGFHCWRTGENPCAEIGYDLEKRCWGKGIMREALSVVIDYGFRRMGLARIEASFDPANLRSKGLLRRLGFEKEKELRNGEILHFLLWEKWQS